MNGENSTETSNTKADDKSVSALSAPPPDASKNGADGKETPVEGDKKVDAKAADTKDAKAPEAVDFAKWEPKLPEGIAIDKSLLDEFRPLAKELGLKGDGAQKLIDIWSKATKASAESQLKSVEDSRAKGWEALKAHKEIGGAKFDESINLARRAVREFGGQALADRLFALGLDNDDVIVRAFINAGKRLGEDKVGTTAAGPPSEKPDTHEARVSRTYHTMKES